MYQIATQTVTTLETPPPPRSNALLMPSPSTLPSEQNHLYLLFGEYFDGSRVTFYSSTIRYDTVKDEWREYKAGIGPSPRSSAAGVGVPGLGEGGGILIFGMSLPQGSSLCLSTPWADSGDRRRVRQSDPDDIPPLQGLGGSWACLEKVQCR